MIRVIEKYYSISEICFLIGFSDTFVRRRVKGGEFGPTERCLDIDGDLRVPASGVNFFLERHPLKYDLGVKARNAAELRRKLKRADEVAVPMELSVGCPDV